MKPGVTQRPCGIDDRCVGRDVRAEFSVGADGGDAIAFDEKRGVGDDAWFTEFFTDTRARRAGESYELVDVDDTESHSS